MILGFIAACEVVFWVVLVAALLTRYVLRRERLGTLLIWGLPVVDLVLLLSIAADLASGSPPSASHGLGALYLGFTVAFVGPTTAAVDAWFARRLAECPSVPRPPRYGMARARYEWKLFGRAVAACLISAMLLGCMVLIAGDDSSTAPLTRWFATLGVVLAVWFLIAASYTVFPKRAPKESVR